VSGAVSRRHGFSRARLADRIATFFLYGSGALILLLLAWFIGYMLYRGAHAIDWHFLTSEPQALRAGGGIGPQLFNSLYLLVLSMLLTVPLGLGAGIYMAEYAKPGPLADVLRLTTETLASLPSIAVGLFGLLLFVVQLHLGFSVLAGAMALTVLNLPLMVRMTEQSLRAVPRELKEASMGLGVGHWYTIRKVLVPAAFPGLLSGGILTAGRVFGEAAALIYTAGVNSPRLDWGSWNPLDPRSPLYPLRPASTLAVHIWKTNSEGLVPDLRRVADGSAAVLVVGVLLFNLLARYAGSRIQRRMEGR
jgi:phosphate transport system permease protein